jgi:pyrimidine operon attenuation protein/uracil phosphoribosyltransferase
MKKTKTLLKKAQFQLTIDRLCHQLIENYDNFENTCLVGIQEGGVLMGNRIHSRLLEILALPTIEYGKLDITFYRDDFRTRTDPLKANTNEMNFMIEGKKVILLDDVLYTGRSVHAAMTALQHYGRPENVELMVMVDRRFNRHLPIQPDYVGLTIDSFDESYVKVEWAGINGKDRIRLVG